MQTYTKFCQNGKMIINHDIEKIVLSTELGKLVTCLEDTFLADVFPSIIKTYEEDNQIKILSGGEVILAIKAINKVLGVDVPADKIDIPDSWLADYDKMIAFLANYLADRILTDPLKKAKAVVAIKEKICIRVEKNSDYTKIYSPIPEDNSVNLSAYEEIKKETEGEATYLVVKHALCIPHITVKIKEQSLAFYLHTEIIAEYFFDLQQLNYYSYTPFLLSFNNSMVSFKWRGKINPSNFLDLVVGSYISRVLSHGYEEAKEIDNMLKNIIAIIEKYQANNNPTGTIDVEDICFNNKYLVVACGLLRLLGPYTLKEGGVYSLEYNLDGKLRTYEVEKFKKYIKDRKRL